MSGPTTAPLKGTIVTVKQIILSDLQKTYDQK